jgi:arylsulfatase
MRYFRSKVSALVISALSAAIVAVPTAFAQDQPNIVVIFMDNFGWGEPGFNGGGIVRGAPTPRLDRLADEGLRLTNFNVEVQCTPSRSALMTGRYAIRSGNGTVPLGEGVYGLVQWEVTMAEMLSEAGYATGMYGKWHLGRTEGRFPTDQGFDEWYGIPNTTDESVYSSLPGFAESGVPPGVVMSSQKGQPPETVRPYDLEFRPLIDRELTDRAIAFMKRSAESRSPFFVYLPYTATHFPTLPHPDFAGESGNGLWGDILMQIDSYVGELLDAIDDLGIADDTIVIFTADNGPEALEAGGTSLTVETAVHGSAGPWRGSLFTGFEGALRVPFVMRWPGEIDAGSESDEIVHAMDLFPTFARFGGGRVPDDRPIDGIDVSEFLLGNSAKSGREGFVVYMGNDVFGVKWQDWKIHFKEQDAWNTVLRTYAMPRVYNLMNDPQESDNVLFPHTWVLKAGLRQLEEHVASLKDHAPIPAGTRDPYQPPH